jgi:hypothetical protein
VTSSVTIRVGVMPDAKAIADIRFSMRVHH